MSLNTQNNQQAPRKPLKVAKPFVPDTDIQQTAPTQQAPYQTNYPLQNSQPFYPPPQPQNWQQQTYIPPYPQQQQFFQQQQPTQPFQPPAQVQPQQPAAPAPPKEKKKLKLSNTTKEFKPALSVEQQLAEDLAKKQLEEEVRKQEELKKQELLKPKAYSPTELEAQINTLLDLIKNEYFMKENWTRLVNRKFSSLTDIPQRHNNRQSTNNNSNNNKPQYDNRNNRKSTKTQAPQPQQNNVELNQRGTMVLVQETTDKTTGSKLTVRRQIEDFTVAQRREEMKNVLGWLDGQSTEDDLMKIKKEINFKLNQLAPDNFEPISQYLVDILINNKQLADHFAERIIEKSQIEPKYRSQYTNLCASLTQEPKLLIQKDNKKNAIFRTALLNKVQTIFEGRNAAQIDPNITKEQKEILHIQRKVKIMGNVRFIGDLFLKKILPAVAVSIAVKELVAEYLSGLLQNEANEESIEGLVELLDQIGQNYNFQAQYDLVALTNFFNGQGKEYKVTEAFIESQAAKQLPTEAIFSILDLLKTQYKLSSRVGILVENLQERKRTGWKEIIHQKGESAKTSKQLLQEQYDKEDQQHSNKQSGRQHHGDSKGGSIQYVEKNSQQQQKQQYQQQDNNYKDLVEMSQFIEETFKMEPETQCDKLLNELKTILDDKEGQVKFFEVFFKQILKPKKSNIDRLSTVYRLISNTQGLSERSLRDGLQKALYTDFIYDICESPAAKEVFIDILMAFINEEDYQSLNKLYLRPIEDIEEYQDFLGSIIQSLITQVPNSRDPLVQYTRSLKFDFEFE